MPIDSIQKDTASLAAELSSCDSVCVHVRRGDLIANPQYARSFGTLGMDYYDRALHEIRDRVPGARAFVFSDDPMWATNNLPGVLPATMISDPSRWNSVHEFRLMSSCNHFIIANSTFSWWAAWLSVHNKKNVIAPKQWFCEKKTWEDDLVPANWIRC
jgi:tellurite resistance-related uncharacterized protein